MKSGEELRSVLQNLKDGGLGVEEAYELLKELPYLSLENVKFDTHRQLRRGLPEVVYGEGKRIEDLLRVIAAFNSRKSNLLITRLSADKAARLSAEYRNLNYDPDSRVLFVKNSKTTRKGKGSILVLSAGSSDLPVAREAELCARYLGNTVELIADVGIAGVHRVLDFRKNLKKARVIIVVAGMEGALPSFIASLTDKPVIAVPTSVGYGANLMGFTALMGMLSSCSGGITVVNIDNGFGAAYFASLVNRL